MTGESGGRREGAAGSAVGRGAGDPAVAAAHQHDPDDPGGDHRQRRELRHGEPDVVGRVAADELDEEPLRAREDEVEGEQDPGPERIAVSSPESTSPVFSGFAFCCARASDEISRERHPAVLIRWHR